MSELSLFSLILVVSLALLLCFSALLHGKNARGLAVCCGAVALWAGAVALSSWPASARFGGRLMTAGGFVVAAYLHAAYNLTGQRRYALVWLAYGSAAALVLLHAIWPGLLYDHAAQRGGPLFWPSMGVAALVGVAPVRRLWAAYCGASPDERRPMVVLALAGLFGYLGAAATSIMFSSGLDQPVGLLVVLASLLLLAQVVSSQRAPGARRLMERNVLYAALSALLSTLVIVGLVWGLRSAEVVSTRQAFELCSLFFFAALAFEPLRLRLQELLGTRLMKGSAHAAALAHALAEQEQRATQARQLAELGTFVSAVAHEIRGPLGVMAAQIRRLPDDREGDSGGVTTLSEQIRRAERFIEDLLRFGRPRPLEPREVELDALIELGFSTARAGLGEAAPPVELELAAENGVGRLEADSSQLLQVLVILLENALLALSEAPAQKLSVRVSGDADQVVVDVEDSGPGVPQAIASRLFEPFVSGRHRDGARPGTGLGLAIARGIIERHGGRIEAGRSALGGARLRFELPRRQCLMAAAAEAR
ncbi:MAG: sensor histidine kinase [Polyangiaceae bacterium]|nr:sensor histidine kinase [Polyangiaceae bacterium]